MLFMSFFKWWYGLGWRDQFGLVRQRLSTMADFFSIGLSLRTLFSPFKQIDAESARRGSFDVILRAMFDQLFSRLFGAAIRGFLIVFGCVELLLELLIGVVRLAVWPFIPLVPALTLVISLMGWKL